MLAKLTDLQTRLELASGAQTTLLTELINAAERQIAGHLRRELAWATGLTADFDGDVGELRLPRWPISTGSGPTVKVATDWDFTSAPALAEHTDYGCVRARGVIFHLPDESLWPAGRGVIRVTWNGGWADPASANPPAGSSPPPPHVNEALLLQAVYMYRRLKDLGQSAMDQTGVGGSQTLTREYGLLEAVRELVASERRI